MLFDFLLYRITNVLIRTKNILVVSNTFLGVSIWVKLRTLRNVCFLVNRARLKDAAYGHLLHVCVLI